MKVYLVYEQGDPYEPGFLHAVCSSMDRVKELFPNKPVSEHIGRDPKTDGSLYRNIHTGVVKDCGNWSSAWYVEKRRLTSNNPIQMNELIVIIVLAAALSALLKGRDGEDDDHRPSI